MVKIQTQDSSPVSGYTYRWSHFHPIGYPRSCEMAPTKFKSTTSDTIQYLMYSEFNPIFKASRRILSPPSVEWVTPTGGTENPMNIRHVFWARMANFLSLLNPRPTLNTMLKHDREAVTSLADVYWVTLTGGSGNTWFYNYAYFTDGTRCAKIIPWLTNSENMHSRRGLLITFSGIRASPIWGYFGS